MTVESNLYQNGNYAGVTTELLHPEIQKMLTNDLTPSSFRQQLVATYLLQNAVKAEQQQEIIRLTQQLEELRAADAAFLVAFEEKQAKGQQVTREEQARYLVLKQQQAIAKNANSHPSPAAATPLDIANTAQLRQTLLQTVKTLNDTVANYQQQVSEKLYGCTDLSIEQVNAFDKFSQEMQTAKQAPQQIKVLKQFMDLDAEYQRKELESYASQHENYSVKEKIDEEGNKSSIVVDNDTQRTVANSVNMKPSRVRTLLKLLEAEQQYGNVTQLLALYQMLQDTSLTSAKITIINADGDQLQQQITNTVARVSEITDAVHIEAKQVLNNPASAPSTPEEQASNNVVSLQPEPNGASDAEQKDESSYEVSSNSFMTRG